MSRSWFSPWFLEMLEDSPAATVITEPGKFQLARALWSLPPRIWPYRPMGCDQSRSSRPFGPITKLHQLGVTASTPASFVLNTDAGGRLLPSFHFFFLLLPGHGRALLVSGARDEARRRSGEAFGILPDEPERVV